MGRPAPFVSLTLETPPLPLLVREGVFDAFGWHPSTTVEWRQPEGWRTGDEPPLDGQNPPGLAFIFNAECTFLPRELAQLHVPRLALEHEWALAPYAIDDATDELYAHRVEPRSVLSVATESLSALVWGLHDWAPFHNHGEFVARAETELQCDLSALAWLAMNAKSIGLARDRWEQIKRELASLSERRFREESLETCDSVWRGALLRLRESDVPWLGRENMH